MDWWMYICVALAGFFGGMAVETYFKAAHGRNYDGYLMFGAAALLPFAVWRYWPDTTLPFWLSISLVPVELIAFGIIVKNELSLKRLASKSSLVIRCSACRLGIGSVREVQHKVTIGRDKRLLLPRLP
ncbi:MAG: hypothetical protein ACLQU1_31955 [Bryobacteraceae bacterium]